MRFIMLIPAVFAFAAPAVAQGWQEYSYPDYFFTISFPAEPQIETTTCLVGERTVDARVFAVRRDDAEFKVTVVDLADVASRNGAVMDGAIKMLSAGGEVKVNLRHRIGQVFGRQLSILQGDGSRISAALFNYDGRLYQIEGKSLPSAGNATADAIRFVQSLVFTGDGSSNRSKGWKEYNYPDYSFAVAFPAEPQIQTTTYPVSADRTVNARVYAVRDDDTEFKLTVADLGDPLPEEAAVIDNAIKTLSAGGEVKTNIPHRTNRVFGRRLSILLGNGSRISAALFDYNGRLYQIEGKSRPSGRKTAADAIRFVQSLTFTGGGSNRSPDE